MPVHLIHGDADDFAPLETAQRLARELKMRRRLRFATVAGANHFLNDGPAEDLLAALEACIPPRRALSMPSLGVGLPRIAPSALPDLRWPDLGLRGRTGSPIPA